MLVDRRILNVARDKMDEALTLLAEERTRLDVEQSARIYRPNIAAFDQIIVEFEFANWAEMEEFWLSWQTRGAEAFFAKWADVAVPGGKRELWETV
ncbi:MAG TPA: hypothetical protein P5121_29690 [Caldilineaceae bacterium]|nr:hypothetical protein [Caldilineaceae bacterium]